MLAHETNIAIDIIGSSYGISSRSLLLSYNNFSFHTAIIHLTAFQAHRQPEQFECHCMKKNWNPLYPVANVF